MSASTCFRDAILQSDSDEVADLFPAVKKQFFVRRQVTAIESRFCLNTNQVAQASPQAQCINHEDVLVRLPSLRISKWKVTVLQRWVGRVERVMADQFVAVLADATSSQNPPEEVELDIREVSTSDLPLMAAGATFYCSIGYRDTPGGQRERIFTLRFARQPRLSEADMNRVFERADDVAALLERD